MMKNTASETPAPREKGTVKWFNDAKGYGFILRPGKVDVMVHHTGIQGDGHRTLIEGEVVEFEVQEGPKGLFAVNVTRTAVARG
jgi:CspA family cold shock protein